MLGSMGVCRYDSYPSWEIKEVLQECVTSTLRQIENSQQNMPENRYKGLKVRVPDPISPAYR